MENIQDNIQNLVTIKTDIKDIFDDTNVKVTDGMKSYGDYISEMSGNVGTAVLFNLQYSTFEITPDFGEDVEFNINQYISQEGIFAHCPNLKEARYYKNLPSNFTFEGCSKLTTVPAYKWDKFPVRMSATFEGCSELEDVSQIQVSNCVDMRKTFRNCYSLKNLPTFDLTSIDNDDYTASRGLDWTFENCTSLVEAPEILLPSGGGWSVNNTCFGTFEGCTNLVSVPAYNMGWSYYNTSMFSGCVSLQHLGGFPQLKSSLSLSDSPLLTHDSLMNVINNLANTSSAILNLGETNLAKLTEDEIAIATNKGWTLT